MGTTVDSVLLVLMLSLCCSKFPVQGLSITLLSRMTMENNWYQVRYPGVNVSISAVGKFNITLEKGMKDRWRSDDFTLVTDPLLAPAVMSRAMNGRHSITHYTMLRAEYAALYGSCTNVTKLDGRYRLRVREGTSEKELKFRVFLKYPPIPRKEAAVPPEDIKEGQKQTMNCDVCSNPAASFKWLYNGGHILPEGTRQDGSILIIESFEVERHNGMYKCMASNTLAKMADMWEFNIQHTTGYIVHNVLYFVMAAIFIVLVVFRIRAIYITYCNRKDTQRLLEEEEATL